jgi:hypothetical protein
MAAKFGPDEIVLPTASSDPTGSEGSLYYNTSSNTMRVKSSTGWAAVYEPPIGSVSTNPAQSCKAIVDANADNGDGYYWITVSGTAVQLYCDMTFNPTSAGYGRGWTKIATGCPESSGAVGTIQPNTVTNQYTYTTTWKLADSDINNIRTTDGILIGATSVHGFADWRLLRFQGQTNNWTSTAQMSGTAQTWDGSSWLTYSVCAEDRGPGQCDAGQGRHFTYTANPTSTNASCSDFRWRYTGGWTNRCLFRSQCCSDSPCNGDGAHMSFVH